jgi:hypothetical protein
VTNGTDLNIIPNPNNGAFTIRGTLGTGADEQVTIQVTDVLGQEVYHGQYNSEKRQTKRAGTTEQHSQWHVHGNSATPPPAARCSTW